MTEKKWTLGLLALLLLIGFAGGSWFFCGAIYTGWSAWLFYARLGHSIAVLEVPMLLAGFQWVVAPWLVYHMENVTRYPMDLPEPYYMGIAVPAYLFFCIGLTLFNAEVMPPREEAGLRISKFTPKLMILVLVGHFMRFTPLAAWR